MKLPIYQVDAFTDELFKGNSAAVVPLEQWLSDAQMQSIAIENNLSETAFLVREPDGAFHIRWFSPFTEIDFCGHATLASAFVLLSHRMATAPLTFRAAAVGDVSVVQLGGGLLEMNFPNRGPERVDNPSPELLNGLGIVPHAVLKSSQAWFAVYEDEEQVRALTPDLAVLKTLAPLDVVITAPGREQDFVSRYFWPANGGDEDQSPARFMLASRRIGPDVLANRRWSRCRPRVVAGCCIAGWKGSAYSSPGGQCSTCMEPSRFSVVRGLLPRLRFRTI